MGNEKIVETRLKDGPKEKSSSETKVKKMAEEIESKFSVASASANCSKHSRQRNRHKLQEFKSPIFLSAFICLFS